MNNEIKNIKPVLKEGLDLVSSDSHNLAKIIVYFCVVYAFEKKGKRLRLKSVTSEKFIHELNIESCLKEVLKKRFCYHEDIYREVFKLYFESKGKSASYASRNFLKNWERSLYIVISVLKKIDDEAGLEIKLKMSLKECSNYCIEKCNEIRKKRERKRLIKESTKAALIFICGALAFNFSFFIEDKGKKSEIELLSKIEQINTREHLIKKIEDLASNMEKKNKGIKEILDTIAKSILFGRSIDIEGEDFKKLRAYGEKLDQLLRISFRKTLSEVENFEIKKQNKENKSD